VSQERGTYFATCPPGLEAVLHRELEGLRVARVERQMAGVRFDATVAEVWAANLRLRTAIRVLRRLVRFPCADDDALYRGVQSVDWRQFLPPEGTLWIDARCRDSQLTHSQFIAQRTKDAIVDQLRERRGERPQVDREDPTLRVDVHLVGDRAIVSLDTSGHSLHRRGWRLHQGRAPLSECLAAGIVLLSEWNGRAPLVDPFCGTGTILVEAGLIATHTAPGLRRRTPFGFERWPDHDGRAFAALRAAVAAEVQPLGKRWLVGSDLDPVRVAEAREHLAAAGLEGERVDVDVERAEDFDPRPGWNACLVTNPPYGERLGEGTELLALYRRFGQVLRERASGSRLALLCADPQLLEALELERTRRHKLVNGGLDCELLTAELSGAGTDGRRPQSRASGRP
jgi:23S rRNA (guanine2445-N2)-methyltransferase / 23S rRNA (guanine2069-N7)-methyltransferase